ncbi:hypothetical protein [Alloprevotella tannerae]|uniref:hypothetical protein n=1 Tax=Alloprevotella tannerae TaxID=76122 RepID=UPI0028EC8D18|nr:hypothetical protein [Alloprevotella tannerae]
MHSRALLFRLQIWVAYRLVGANDGMARPNDSLLPPNDGLLPANKNSVGARHLKSYAVAF